MVLSDICIETDRLILRVPQIEDFDRYAQMLADEAATRYIGGSAPRAAAWRRFLQMPGAWLLQGFGMFSVLEKASGLWMGQIGPWKPDGWPGNEIGYAFHPDAWGQGYALEAGVASIDWAFEHLGWDSIVHCIAPANAASIALAQRFGSRHIGPAQMPAPYQDSPTEMWGQSRSEWLARSNLRRDG
ncbi:MAG: GNAT family N-acetyltransferase [Xanthomonadaceae bacterium]|nr:GNAT family N-acetyltransferase [Xanthomonadaceae bacterium]